MVQQFLTENLESPQHVCRHVLEDPCAHNQDLRFSLHSSATGFNIDFSPSKVFSTMCYSNGTMVCNQVISKGTFIL